MYPTTIPKSSLASPPDAAALDALRSAVMQANIAVLVLLNSKLVDDGLRFDLLQAVRDVQILNCTTNCIVDGFSRAAEKQLLQPSPMDLAKTRLAETVRMKGGAK